MSSSNAPPDAGLCASCARARDVDSSRGSVFLLCQLSLTDARFPRYPPLPVLACAGYVRAEQTELNRHDGTVDD